ncbi:MAG: TIM barrel protein [Deferrisomatales bacterium]|nr:TIM barrel protein [Deferrisomatales bacterium]
MFSLSTAYFTLREPELSGETIAREALGLGFRTLEFDYRVSRDQLRTLEPLVGRGEVEVVSVHHPFPRPPGVPPAHAHTRGPTFASLDRRERSAAVAAGVETLARAADLGAGVVVLHLGTARLPPEIDARELEERVRAGERETPAYATLLAAVTAARRSRAGAHLDAALSSLDRLAGEAQRRGVRLGLENRYHADETPDREELLAIFGALDGAPLGYWHDTGHAASLVTLGFLARQTEVLEACPERVVGFHLHDARGLDDHLAPGEGELDFSVLAPFVLPGVPVVLEVHPGASPEALLRGRTVLVAAGLANGGPRPEPTGAVPVVDARHPKAE